MRAKSLRTRESHSLRPAVCRAADYIRRIIALQRVWPINVTVFDPLWLQNRSWHRQVTHVDRLPFFLASRARSQTAWR